MAEQNSATQCNLDCLQQYIYLLHNQFILYCHGSICNWYAVFISDRYQFLRQLSSFIFFLIFTFLTLLCLALLGRKSSFLRILKRNETRTVSRQLLLDTQAQTHTQYEQLYKITIQLQKCVALKSKMARFQVMDRNR